VGKLGPGAHTFVREGAGKTSKRTDLRSPRNNTSQLKTPTTWQNKLARKLILYHYIIDTTYKYFTVYQIKCILLENTVMASRVHDQNKKLLKNCTIYNVTHNNSIFHI